MSPMSGWKIGFTAGPNRTGHRRSAEPDWAKVHREPKRKHMTLSILWDEYIEQHPAGYRYSRHVAPEFMLRELREVSIGARIMVLDAT
jgi:hypothetical protein